MLRNSLLLTAILLLATNGLAGPISITPTTSATTLVNAILGPGVVLVGSPSYTGVANQSGTFTGGGVAVGFDSGIVLTSGNATQIPGLNTNGPESVGGGGTSDDLSTDLGQPGYAGLTALAGYPTYDAAVLSFSFEFTGGGGGDLYFNFVFGSEEYINWIGSQFNDVFGFWVDGVNIALVPGTSTPITINTINNSANSGYYRNNVTNTAGLPVAGYDIKFDGLTTVIQAKMLGLGAGTHTMVFAVGDASDHILDAGVFIQGGTFSNTPINPDIPEPGTLALLGGGLLALGLARRLRRS